MNRFIIPKEKLKKASKEIPMKMFVYGTLRRGQANHFLMQNATFLGEAKTIKKYLHLPIQVFKDQSLHGREHVKGEVYEINDANTLVRIDELEMHPDWYKRELIEVKMENGNIIKAWIYFYPQTGWFLPNKKVL